MGVYDKQAYDYLMSNIKNKYGVSGLLGNMFAESGLNPINLQNTSNTKLGLTDEAYTMAVDKGTYKNFTTDSAGYGFCQWTSSSRKKSLLDYSKQRATSIGSAEMQLEFLYLELKNNYPGVLKALENAKSVREASDAVLLKFEMPKDQSEAVRVKRAAYGQNFYDKYAV